MAWEAWLTIAVTVFVIVALARAWAGSDLVVMAGVTGLTAIGMLAGSEKLPDAADAFAGFGNPGLLTVAALYIVVEGLVRTQAMAMITEPLLGSPRTVLTAQARLMLPVMGLSAFLNNTPVVAMFLPVVEDICKKARISPSKLFLPLSYAAIFGGVCTLIGTSTNLVVNGLLIAHRDTQALGMFDITPVGLACAVAGTAYLLVLGRWLLPDRKPPISLSDDPKQYTVEMLVQGGGPLVGRTVEAAGLRHLPGLYLAEIERDGEVLPAVGPEERLRAGDRLVFVGILDSVLDLQKTRGLQIATNQVFRLQGSTVERTLVEAVVSDRCPLVGHSVREGRFRSVYNAAVIAVARSGRRVHAKIGDIVLRPGDTLLLETHRDFAAQHRNSRDFFLVSGVAGATPLRRERAWMALAILVAMVASVTAGWLDMLVASLVAAGAMIVARCCTGPEARQSLDISVLVVIGASFGIGKALDVSGAAPSIASSIVSLAGGDPWLVLLAVYLVTTVFTELITNNAAAVLVFPIALSSAESLGVSFMPFVIAVMIGASASFSTPLGYQTNLMVYGPGGYRFTDYLRVGIPLNLVFMVVTVLLAPMLFPF
ncbi:SLC13 family permease [Candidatus Binatia bacterium]|nr:SLC13 family permease [Candidatus Binatia bacterium]